MGEKKVTVSNEAIYAKLLEIQGLLDEVRPLLPHIPAALKLLDNPATRFVGGRRAVRQNKRGEVPQPQRPEVHREAG